MKTMKLIAYALVVMMLFVSACSKKVMENQSATDQDTQPASTPEPVVATPAPAPEPPPENTSAEGRTMFINQLVYFDFDSAVLKPDAQSMLQGKAQWLQDNPDVTAIIIEGHCDERGTDAYNMALGAKRAEAVQNYLTNLGVDISRLETQSYGEEKPAALGHNEEAWSQNRRASFVIN
ncbi:MAG: peptidoglycan-associated lipoprotein Pal [Desulfobacteraceae bacterium]|jgi:peptidoglycan-associated lipoprotein